MSPRKKQYESDAERQKAYRERKKQKQTLAEKIKAGITNLFNGNHNYKEDVRDEDDSNIIGENHLVGNSNQPESKPSNPNGIAIIYDKETGERINTEAHQSSDVSPLKSEDSKMLLACRFCGECEYCHRFKDTKYWEVEQEIAKRLAFARDKCGLYDYELVRLEQELRQKLRKERGLE